MTRTTGLTPLVALRATTATEYSGPESRDTAVGEYSPPATEVTRTRRADFRASNEAFAVDESYGS